MFQSLENWNISYFVTTLNALTLIWVGFLGVRFAVVVVGGKISPPCLKPVRIMLETLNLARKYTPRKYTF